MSGSERFPLVDETGAVIGTAARAECHGNPALLHPVVHCLVTNRAGDLLLQLRSRDKDIQPGKWDTSVGGHVMAGESVAQALARELDEEIGLAAAAVTPRFRYRYVMCNAVEAELVHTYTCIAEGPFRPQASEIEALRFWTRDAVARTIGSGVFTPNFEDEYGRFLRAEAEPGWTR